MAGETVITVVGNLTADPELRTIGSGASVCSFTIASTPRNWNRQTNQFEDGQALFMRCSAWRFIEFAFFQLIFFIFRSVLGIKELIKGLFATKGTIPSAS